MSSTLTCPSCGCETPSEYNFCTVCDQQTKCLNPICNKKLVPGKTFCFGCGQPVAKINTSQTQSNKYVHRVKQEGKNYEEYTELNASDQAVSELAPFIVGQITSRSLQKPYSPSSLNGSIKPSHKAVNTDSLSLESQELPQLPAEIPGIQPAEPSKENASPYFEPDGEFLVATAKDFKGKNWADQQRHFILLYASAFYHYFEKPVPSKDNFKSAAQRASVLDITNFSRYLNEHTRKHLSEIGGGYKLNHDGEKEVKRIIALMEDDNVEMGYQYWARSTNSTTKRHRPSKDDKDRLKEWAQEEVEIGKIEVRDIKNARDYAMVALWIINIHLKKANAVRWNDAYYFFKEKFETISVSAQAFSRAMASSKNTKYFRQSGDQYFLTTEGQQKVEEWVAGHPFGSSIEAEDVV